MSHIDVDCDRFQIPAVETSLLTHFVMSYDRAIGIQCVTVTSLGGAYCPGWHHPGGDTPM